MNTVLFDLDGTLLPMDQDAFMEVYLRELGTMTARFGYQPEEMIKAVWAGLKAMIQNDGSVTNEERFWETASQIVGEEIRNHIPDFHNFYLTEFKRVKQVTSPTDTAKKCVQLLKDKRYTLALATNAIFPRVATLERIAWAGLDHEDFKLITTYEDFSYTKPNLNYYRTILQIIGKQPEDCLMVGNDVQEDMCVTELGINTYLVTDCLINRSNEDISAYQQSNMAGFYKYVQELPVLQK